jgi:carboxyl-terminal processing protease
MKKKKFLVLGLILLAPLLFLVEKSSIRGISFISSPPKNLYLLETVFRYIRNDYIEEVDPLKTVEGSFKGLVNSLDSYSAYFNKENTARYLEQREGPYKEPGLILFKRYGSFPVVVGLVEDSPAQKAGLVLGDAVTEINGLSTPPMSLAEVNLYIRGKGEEPLELKILRDDKTLEMKVERASLPTEPLTYSPLEGASGTLRISRLAPPCLTILKTKLFPTLSKKKKTLVLDMRTCQEGTFEEARQLVNFFLKAESIGYLEKKGGKSEFFSSLEEPALPDIPLVVWVSQATSGPAEVVAAVLKKNNRAKIVGLPTLGLAAENEFFLLKDGTSVLLTSAIFCLDSGVKLWGQGVEPDIQVDAEDLSFDSYLKKSKSLIYAP